MPTFRYKAVTPSGDIMQGQMEAVSTQEVVSRLQADGNVPISAEESGQGAAGSMLDFLSGGRRVSQRDTGLLTQQLATLLGAGLPLDRALQILEDLAESEPLQKLIKAIRDQVRGGSSLSDALESQHGVFPRMYINMVRGGEAGGTLESTLARLADYMKRSKELRDSVISALIYPALLVVLAIGSLMVLLAYVVPQFTPIFEELGEGLPLITELVLLVGRILQGYWWALAIGFFGIFAYFRQQMAQAESRLRWDARLLRSRVTGSLVSRIEMARLARTVGTLLSNGVPLLTSLSIGKSVLSNTVMAEGVEAAAKEVKTGDSLAHALAATELFPKLALQMISVGEETGRLDTMLNDVADAYDVEVKTTVDRMMALLVPALTLVLAALIAMIIIAVMLPILQVTELV
ncbi:MAG: type II secretion system inner membrane protein GspF [Xanthomonadales bacterium]|nr:type II secretion system inner membrane protein GspF [Xanthomonadales bacterium]